jgi:hypothetical protein
MGNCYGSRRIYCLAGSSHCRLNELLLKPLFSKIILMCMLLTAAIVYLFKHCRWYLPEMINNYLNDLLVIPIVLACCLICVRYIKKDPKINLSVFNIISIIFLYTTYFEYYLPLYNLRYTADSIDCILYAAGGTFFYFWQKLEAKCN